MASRARTVSGRGTRSAAAATLAVALLLAGCGGSADPGTTAPPPVAPSATTPSSGTPSSGTPSAGAPSGGAPSSGAPSGASSAATPDTLTIAVTMTGEDVSPNAEKIDATVGQQVVLQVTSDIADEVHAHTGGDGYELEVPAGEPTTGTFTLDSPGSFEIESHHREKIIVILNVR